MLATSKDYTMKTLTLTEKEFRLIREMCDSWIPSTPSGKVTKADDKLTLSICKKIQAIRDAEGCVGRG